MRINSINQFYQKKNYNYQNKTSFKAKTMPQADVIPSGITEKGKAVLEYVKNGCPQTEEGTKLFQKKFNPDFFDSMHNHLSIASILDKCENNLDVINRALGKYGLEAYGKLGQGSTIKNARESLVETGYYSLYSDINDNFINYLFFNQNGKLSELEERFGNYGSLYLDNLENIGIFRTFINSYSLVNDEFGENTLYLQNAFKDMRARALQNFIKHNPL